VLNRVPKGVPQGVHALPSGPVRRACRFSTCPAHSTRRAMPAATKVPVQDLHQGSRHGEERGTCRHLCGDRGLATSALAIATGTRATADGFRVKRHGPARFWRASLEAALQLVGEPFPKVRGKVQKREGIELPSRFSFIGGVEHQESGLGVEV